MHLPILVFENGDLNIFDSISEAQTYLEPIDIERSEYEAFDAVGSPLQLFVCTKSKKNILRFFGGSRKEVGIQEISAALPTPDIVRRKLMDYLYALGRDKSSFETLSLDELVVLVKRPKRKKGSE